MSDEYIMNYVKKDNYKKDGEIILANKLANLPQEWDYNENGKWDGYVPDCYFDFDSEGFDRDPAGSYTGWRAFAYTPFLGTFWPTNGSTDDVLIRLAEPFMQDREGVFDIDVYKLNLLIVESLIKQKNIEMEPVDERLYGVDLDQDGKLGVAKRIVFKWETPKYDSQKLKVKEFSMSYVGKAKELLKSNEYLIAPGLYPKDTEFLHTVRYIDVKSDGSVSLAPRLKELRYGKKHFWYNYFQLSNAGMESVKEREAEPDSTARYIGDIEVGLNNKLGWYYQGFIEDKSGELRPQSYEETLFCMGCHSNIGAIADSTFVYQRKLEKGSYQDGWYHWSQKGLEGIKDRELPNGETEYVRYLKSNNAGDEFRQNKEVMEKFFVKGWEDDTENIKKDLAIKRENPDAVLAQEWKLKKEAVEKLKNDISYLILPSKERAMMLNKAYKVIVDEQSFIYGRDAHVSPANNVHTEVEDAEPTHLWVIERQFKSKGLWRLYQLSNFNDNWLLLVTA
eukprot:TRINITY_DN5987_c0_g1_i1.p1 TRINITY_DN5987_c0_g1~~TRINITY_DN5987_c0_g1_i1.p1  ORF type:complete len:549 (+),score=60.18 TRINITY_DN5987_c0_g1_i1:132-1649(+)